ncbi:MAG TPA: preprotein translocase subunit SecE [Blastocatellia bacterium]|jgi:preprotein translocase subunit SecE|nr:preprotein translocase subunit SecE [Blastocatellia bacterium]
MSRVTEFPDEEGPLREEAENVEGTSEGRAGAAIKAPKIPFFGRIGEFYQEIKLEMRKVTWPTRKEVWSTTVVVLIAVTFFGFYLFGVDWLVTKGFNYLEGTIK